jgi:hypothetical protein
MSSIEQLGRVFDLEVSSGTTATRVRLDKSAGIGIVITGSTGTVTITEATAVSGGTSQTMVGKPFYYTKASGVWSARTQAGSGGTVVTTTSLTYVWIPGGLLSSGFSYVAASLTGASFLYIAGDLNVLRRPANLQALSS